MATAGVSGTWRSSWQSQCTQLMQAFSAADTQLALQEATCDNLRSEIERLNAELASVEEENKRLVNFYAEREKDYKRKELTWTQWRERRRKSRKSTDTDYNEGNVYGDEQNKAGAASSEGGLPPADQEDKEHNPAQQQEQTAMRNLVRSQVKRLKTTKPDTPRVRLRDATNGPNDSGKRAFAALPSVAGTTDGSRKRRSSSSHSGQNSAAGPDRDGASPTSAARNCSPTPPSVPASQAGSASCRKRSIDRNHGPEGEKQPPQPSRQRSEPSSPTFGARNRSRQASPKATGEAPTATGAPLFPFGAEPVNCKDKSKHQPTPDALHLQTEPPNGIKREPDEDTEAGVHARDSTLSTMPGDMSYPESLLAAAADDPNLHIGGLHRMSSFASGSEGDSLPGAVAPSQAAAAGGPTGSARDTKDTGAVVAAEETASGDLFDESSMDAEAMVREAKRARALPYKYKEVVRNKEERWKLPAKSCSECDQWFRNNPLYKDKEAHMRHVCRHRTTATPPPDSGSQFWMIDFPDTLEDPQQAHLLPFSRPKKKPALVPQESQVVSLEEEPSPEQPPTVAKWLSTRR
eukprot:m.22181 g.22181  ORF g.22181 m.22181 type:complete len:576 (+) comp6711_c0_seq1:61-1788(+)